MKTLKKLTLIVTLTLIVGTIIYTSLGNRDHHHFSEIPALKERHVMIDPVDEWDNVRNQYEALIRILNKKPEDIDAKLKLVRIFSHEGRVTGEDHYYNEAALYLVDEVIDFSEMKKEAVSKDQLFETLTMKSYVLLSQHRFSEALAVGKKAMVLNPHSSHIYGALVDANVELGNYEEAVKMCEKMMDLRPDIRSYSRTSYLREIHGDVEGAIEVMKMAVASGAPGNEQTAWCRVTLGKLYENYGDLTNAQVQYELTLLERPNYAHALAGLGRIELKKGNPLRAKNLIQQAIEIMPTASIYESSATYYNFLGNKAELTKVTLRMYELLNHFHHNTNAGLETAYLHLRFANDYQKALICLQNEYKTRPENIEVNKLLAWSYLGLNKLTKANFHAEKAYITNSQDPEMLLVAGMIKLKQGEKAQGNELVQKAFAYNPYLVNHLSELRFLAYSNSL